MPGAAELVGDRNPREHEFSVQLRAYDASKAGQSLGVAALLAMCSTLINRSLRGGLVVVGGTEPGRLPRPAAQRRSTWWSLPSRRGPASS